MIQLMALDPKQLNSCSDLPSIPAQQTRTPSSSRQWGSFDGHSYDPNTPTDPWTISHTLHWAQVPTKEPFWQDNVICCTLGHNGIAGQCSLL